MRRSRQLFLAALATLALTTASAVFHASAALHPTDDGPAVAGIVALGDGPDGGP